MLTEVSKIQAELNRIEQEVSKGNYSLKELGFWKVVSEVKKDLNLIEKFADQIGRIDQIASRTKMPVAVNLWIGHFLEILGTIFGLWLIALSINYPNEFIPNNFIRGTALFIAAFILGTTLHPLSHYIMGRLVGIHFTFYFLNGPLKIQPTLKTDYASYLRVSPSSRIAMHASGTIVTKIMPLIVVIIAMSVSAPMWSIILIGILFLVQIITDIVFGQKLGDWSRVLRERHYVKG
ncbi:MAG: hypothetical protein HY929_05385 [Euryarchaeota archaeon]|nr:hypothetical protein [Euryarchaeota archaeon]